MAKIVLHKSSGVDFQCPHCGQEMHVERDMQGTVFDCPACGKQTSCPRAVSTAGAPKNGADDTRMLADIARSSAETAKAVKEIRNLFAAVMIFWLAVFALGIIFAVIGPI